MENKEKVSSQETSNTDSNLQSSNEELIHCTNKLLEAQKESSDWQKKCLIVTADFENFKKRTHKEFESIRKQSLMPILSSLLMIVDDFERALHSEQNDSGHQVEGFVGIAKSLQKILSECGVQEMNNYTVFNPEFHEALMQVEVDGKFKSGDIVTVLQKGYLFQGAVLRHAKVSVAQ